MYHMQDNGIFVPFCETVIRRYPDVKALPPHNVMNPGLLHGEIHLTLTAKTPMMVCGGRHVREGDATVALFATDTQGRYRIPGSSLRGLIRQNMQILGLGMIRAGRGGEIADEPYVDGIHSPTEGLPDSYKIPDDQDFLDYPRSVMGFVGRMRTIIRNGKPKRINDCYRSRVSIGDLSAVGTPRQLRTVLIQQKLPDQDSDMFIAREGGTFRLKGFRQYPLRKVRESQPYDAKGGFRPLEAGTRFTGTIRYRNLHEDELGLLLWCLRLEEGCLHTMGMAKAAGYGQVELKIDSVVEYEPAQLYSALTSGGIRRGETDQRVGQLIDAYRSYTLRHTADLLKMPHIRTFLKLKGWVPAGEEAPVAAAPKPAAPSAKELRRKAKKEAKPQATAEELSSWRAMLSGNFKGN